MSESQFLENPFLNQRASMDWTVVKQPLDISTVPSKSLRSIYPEVLIKSEFIKAVNKTNLHLGRSWLTPERLEILYAVLTNFDLHSLLENNQKFIERLNKWQEDENTVAGEQGPVVEIIDFDNWDANSFVAINQRLDERERFFNDYTLESSKNLIAKFDELEIVERWEETELLRGKDQTWINGLVRKVKQ